MSSTRASKKPRTTNVYRDIVEGFAALRAEHEGKITLRRTTVEVLPELEVTPKMLLQLREQFHLSRPVFAAYLRTNARTLENWEQGRSKPNAQAAVLIHLVRRFPDMLERLRRI